MSGRAARLSSASFFRRTSALLSPRTSPPLAWTNVSTSALPWARTLLAPQARSRQPRPAAMTRRVLLMISRWHGAPCNAMH